MLRLWLCTAPLLFILACGSVRTSVPSKSTVQAKIVPLLDQELPVSLDINTGTLDNGLRYFIRSNQTPKEQAKLHLIIDTGSIHEADDQQGMAHFIEHMAFSGTETFSQAQLAAYFTSINMAFGPHINAYTQLDATVYTLQVPTHEFTALTTAFNIFQDWACKIQFNNKTVDLIRPNVLKEFYGDFARSRHIQQQHLSVLLKGTHYANRPPLGQSHQLETFTATNLAHFYRKHYRPDKMTLIATGDFSEEYIYDLMHQYLGAIPAVKPTTEVSFEAPLIHQDTRFSIVTDTKNAPSNVAIYFTHKLPPQHQIKAYRRFIMRNLCTRLFNQRLNEQAQTPNSPYQRAQAGTGSLSKEIERYRLAAIVPNNQIHTALETLLLEINRVHVHGFTEAELDRQKKESLDNIERAYNDRDNAKTDLLAAELVRHVLYAEPIPGITYELGLHKTFMPQITLDEINQMARDLTPNYNRTILVSVPDRNGVSIPTINELSEIIAHTEQVAITPYEMPPPPPSLTPSLPPPGTIINTSYTSILGLTEWTLSNGIKVLLKPSNLKPDEILFSGFSPGGHSLVDDAEYISAFTATSLVHRSGIGHFSAKSLASLLEKRNVHLAVKIDALREGFLGEATPQELETLLQLLYLYATATPHRSTAAFTAYRNYLEKALIYRHHEPAIVLHDSLQHILSQRHFRTRPWTSDILSEMNLDSSLRIYRERFANMSDFTFILVGDFQLEQIQPLVERYLATLPTTGSQETWRDVGIRPPTGIIKKVIYAGDDSLSRSQFVFPGTFVWNQKNTYLLNSVASILRRQLHQALQTDLGTNPLLKVGITISRLPTPSYNITILIDTLPEHSEGLEQKILEQIELLKSATSVQASIEPIKKIQNQQYQRQFQDNQYWLNALESASYNQTDPMEILKLTELTKALNPVDIAQSAKQYLKTDNYIWIIRHPKYMKIK